MRHFIFSSTAAIYGNPERVPARENDATMPTSPYGSSKLMTEIMLRDASSTHGLHHVILRYFNVAGRPARSYRPWERTLLARVEQDVTFEVISAVAAADRVG